VIDFKGLKLIIKDLEMLEHSKDAKYDEIISRAAQDSEPRIKQARI